MDHVCLRSRREHRPLEAQFLKVHLTMKLTSMPNILSRHKIEVGLTQDTLAKMPSSGVFDLMYTDVNKSDDQHYVKVLIASGLPSVVTDHSGRSPVRPRAGTSPQFDCRFRAESPATTPRSPQSQTAASVTVSPSCRIDVSSDTVSPRKRADVNPFVLWTKRSWPRPEFEKRTAQSVSLSRKDGHEQQHGCEMTLPSLLDSMVSMTRSNTCQNKVLTRIVIFSCSSQSSPSILYTSLLKRWRKPEQQSHEHFVNIADNTEMSDDVLEENNSKIYVKTINKKTISICYYDSMKAAVILDEVEKRTAIPRYMTRLTHKGKDINEKKSMKDNNIDTNETIEMSMRLLGGMEVNEQMDTHETEEDREKKRNLDEGKEVKATKPSEDMAHLRKDIMEALKKLTKKWNATPERMKKK